MSVTIRMTLMVVADIGPRALDPAPAASRLVTGIP
jgi:hypothetical protein